MASAGDPRHEHSKQEYSRQEHPRQEYPRHECRTQEQPGQRYIPNDAVQLHSLRLIGSNLLRIGGRDSQDLVSRQEGALHPVHLLVPAPLLAQHWLVSTVGLCLIIHLEYRHSLLLESDAVAVWQLHLVHLAASSHLQWCCCCTAEEWLVKPPMPCCVMHVGNAVRALHQRLQKIQNDTVVCIILMHTELFGRCKKWTDACTNFLSKPAELIHARCPETSKAMCLGLEVENLPLGCRPQSQTWRWIHLTHSAPETALAKSGPASTSGLVSTGGQPALASMQSLGAM